jgi:hypothetical protein
MGYFINVFSLGPHCSYSLAIPRLNYGNQRFYEAPNVSVGPSISSLYNSMETSPS